MLFNTKVKHHILGWSWLNNFFDESCRQHSFLNTLKVRKTQEGGWIVLAFSSFSPTEVTDQKQIEFNFWSDNQNLNAADKTERKERHKAIIQVPSTNRK